MIARPLLASLAVAAFAAQAPAGATNIAVTANAGWSTFAVDSSLASDGGLGWIDDGGSPLRFTFVIGSGLTGMLTVLDTGFAGDMFSVSNGLLALGSTSTVPVRQYDPAASAIENPAAALGDVSFSRGVFTLGAGSYSIGGSLTQSVLFGSDRLDATSGALRLDIATVAPVPEPSSIALLFAGLGVVGTVARRRTARR